jgi:hypothetical protein
MQSLEESICVKDVLCGRFGLGDVVRIKARLFGTGIRWQYVADSADELFAKVGLPIVGASIFDDLCDAGVPPIGGGRFSISYDAIISASVTPCTSEGFTLGLSGIRSLVVFVNGMPKTVPISPENAIMSGEAKRGSQDPPRLP